MDIETSKQGVGAWEGGEGGEEREGDRGGGGNKGEGESYTFCVLCGEKTQFKSILGFLKVSQANSFSAGDPSFIQVPHQVQ